MVAMRAIPDLDAELAALAARLQRSVVLVHGPGGAGSGTMWNAEGLVVTNNHVVRGERPRIETRDRRRLEARVVARDRERDLAALRIEGDAGDLEAVTTRDASTLRVGELVVAVGNPWGRRGETTLGVVTSTVGPTAELRSRRPAVFADVRLAPGNSGGPLADASGRVVGIASMIAGGAAVGVPAETVHAFLEEAARPPAVLGIAGLEVAAPDGSAGAGLLLTEVVAGSAAERAGLLPGDVLLAVNGVRGGGRELQAVIGRAAAGGVRLELWRGGELRRIEALPAAA